MALLLAPFTRVLSVLLLGGALCHCASRRAPESTHPAKSGASVPHFWIRPDGQRVERRTPGSETLVDCDSAGAKGQTCTCDDDSGCSERPGGFCHRGSWGAAYPPPEPYVHQTCRYPDCVIDADCDGGRVCHPATVSSEPSEAICIPATCRTNADCLRDGEQGVCRIFSARSYAYAPEAHCVYAHSVCDPLAQRRCPSTSGLNNGLGEVCVFRKGVAACEPDPGPRP